MQRRDPKTPDVGDEDQRGAAEEVGVGDREHAERQGWASREPADDREHQCEEQHEDLGDHHQLDVRLEAVPHLRDCAAEAEWAEEGVQELAHLGLRRGGLTGYFRTGGIGLRSHFVTRRLIVPFAVSDLIARSRKGFSLLPFSITAP